MQEPTPKAHPSTDMWTSIVLIALGLAMLGNALGFPLRGTYAGVRNAWYVSPALLPIFVALCLIVLAAVLLARSLRARRAAGEGAPTRRIVTADFWIVGLGLAGFVAVLVPRVDFVAASAFFLLCFTLVYHVALPKVARGAAAAFFAVCTLVLAMRLTGLAGGAAGRTGLFDLVAWPAFAALAAYALMATRADAAARARTRSALAVSLVTAFVLGPVFKYLLLVPLPAEGATVGLMDRVQYALRALN